MSWKLWSWLSLALMVVAYVCVVWLSPSFPWRRLSVLAAPSPHAFPLVRGKSCTLSTILLHLCAGGLVQKKGSITCYEHRSFYWRETHFFNPNILMCFNIYSKLHAFSEKKIFPFILVIPHFILQDTVYFLPVMTSQVRRGLLHACAQLFSILFAWLRCMIGR